MQLELNAVKKDATLIMFVEEDVIPPANNAGYNNIDDDEDYYYCNYGCNPNNWPR